jgi:hypothetical protein
MLKLLILSFFIFPQDSIQKDSVVSIMFKKTNTLEIDRLVYRHSQGFFCDFEDRINKHRKMNLNLGVGEQ